MDIEIMYAKYFALHGVDFFLLSENDQESFHIAFSNIKRDWISDNDCLEICFRKFKKRIDYLPKADYLTFKIIKECS